MRRVLPGRTQKYRRLLSLWILGAGLLDACAHRQRREFLETPIQDLFDHTLLKSVGIHVKELPPRYYEEKLGIFIEQFVADARKRGVIIAEASINLLREVKYVDVLSIGEAPGVMAACNRYFIYEPTLSGQKKIKWTTIEVLRRQSQDYTGSDPAKELILLRELMYHEIFHCLLNKGHLPDGYEGIMSPTFTKGGTRAFDDWEGLLNDMFSPTFLRLIPDAPFS